MVTQDKNVLCVPQEVEDEDVVYSTEDEDNVSNSSISLVDEETIEISLKEYREDLCKLNESYINCISKMDSLLSTAVNTFVENLKSKDHCLLLLKKKEELIKSKEEESSSDNNSSQVLLHLEVSRLKLKQIIDNHYVLLNSLLEEMIVIRENYFIFKRTFMKNLNSYVDSQTRHIQYLIEQVLKKNNNEN